MTKTKPNKITVIGGAGFVGTNLCRLFEYNKQDFEIIDLKVSKQFPRKCKIADVRDVRTLRETITGDVVVHLAAVHRDDVQDKSEYKRTNVNGAENVALVCEEKGINKIVFTSTVAVYGFAKPETDETGEINPFNEYGRTKFEAEEKLRAWQVKNAASLIIVRPTVIFGEGNRGNVFNLFNQIASGRFLMVGSGANKKSMAYIRNVVAFLDTCIYTRRTFGIFNYVDTPNLTMFELVHFVRRNLGYKSGKIFTLPLSIGILAGHFFDVLSNITNKKYLISSIRIKKFISETYFLSNQRNLDNFSAPYQLTDAIARTLEYEFLNSSNDRREVFYTE
jgi:nucleoside-diphosphate-sugar epimerase